MLPVLHFLIEAEVFLLACQVVTSHVRGDFELEISTTKQAGAGCTFLPSVPAVRWLCARDCLSSELELSGYGG